MMWVRVWVALDAWGEESSPVRVALAVGSAGQAWKTPPLRVAPRYETETLNTPLATNEKLSQYEPSPLSCTTYVERK